MLYFGVDVWKIIFYGANCKSISKDQTPFLNLRT